MRKIEDRKLNIINKKSFFTKIKEKLASLLGNSIYYLFHKNRPIIITEIKYDFPKGKPTPFDLNTNAQYFSEGSGLSKLSANLDYFTFDCLYANIPMGYKSIRLLKRVKIFNKGQLLKSWEFEDIADSDNNLVGKFIIISNIKIKQYDLMLKRDIISHYVSNPASNAQSLISSCWTYVSDCAKFAKEFSKNQDVALIIAQVMDDIFWH